MPLLTSPIDGSPMRQIHRYGIEIDVCPTSGGIWLDKGELEKLMAILQEESASEKPNHPRNHDSYKRSRHDDDDDHEGDYLHRGAKYSRKSKASRLMDIFDF